MLPSNPSTPSRRTSSSSARTPSGGQQTPVRTPRQVPSSAIPLNGPEAIRNFLPPIGAWPGVTNGPDSRAEAIERNLGTSTSVKRGLDDEKLGEYKVAFFPCACPGRGCQGSKESSHPAFTVAGTNEAMKLYQSLERHGCILEGNFGKYAPGDTKYGYKDLFAMLERCVVDQFPQPDSPCEWPHAPHSSGVPLTVAKVSWCIARMQPTGASPYPAVLTPVHGGAAGGRTPKSQYTLKNLENYAVPIGNWLVLILLPSLGRILGPVHGFPDPQPSLPRIWSDDVARQRHLCFADKLWISSIGLDTYGSDWPKHFKYLALCCGAGKASREGQASKCSGEWPIQIQQPNVVQTARPVLPPINTQSSSTSTPLFDLSPSSPSQSNFPSNGESVSDDTVSSPDADIEYSDDEQDAFSPRFSLPEDTDEDVIMSSPITPNIPPDSPVTPVAVPRYLQGPRRLPDPPVDLEDAIQAHVASLTGDHPNLWGPDMPALVVGVKELAQNYARVLIRPDDVYPTSFLTAQDVHVGEGEDVWDLAAFQQGSALVDKEGSLWSGKGVLISALSQAVQEVVLDRCPQMSAGSSFRAPAFNSVTRQGNAKCLQLCALGALIGTYVVRAEGNVDLFGFSPFLLAAMVVSKNKFQDLMDAFTPVVIYQIEAKFEHVLRPLFEMTPGSKFSGQAMSNLFITYLDNTQMSEILDEDMEQAELDVYINGIKENCLLGLSQPWDNAEFLSLRQGFSAFAKIFDGDDVESVIGLVHQLTCRRIQDMESVDREISRIYYSASDETKECHKEFAEIFLKEVISDFFRADGDFEEARSRLENFFVGLTDTPAIPLSPLSFCLSLKGGKHGIDRIFEAHTCATFLTFPMNPWMLDLVAFSYSDIDGGVSERPGARMTFSHWMKDQLAGLAFSAKHRLYNAS